MILVKYAFMIIFFIAVMIAYFIDRKRRKKILEELASQRPRVHPQAYAMEQYMLEQKRLAAQEKERRQAEARKRQEEYEKENEPARRERDEKIALLKHLNELKKSDPEAFKALVEEKERERAKKKPSDTEHFVFVPVREYSDYDKDGYDESDYDEEDYNEEEREVEQAQRDLEKAHQEAIERYEQGCREFEEEQAAWEREQEEEQEEIEEFLDSIALGELLEEAWRRMQ